MEVWSSNVWIVVDYTVMTHKCFDVMFRTVADS